MRTETYTLSRAAIAAHLHVAATKDARFCLNGVHLNPVTGHLVSTDGSAMLVTQHEELKRPGAPAVILPREVLAAALKQCPKKAGSFEVDVTPAGNYDPAALVFRSAPGVSQACAAVEGRYPDYLRVIPATVDGTAGNYDLASLARMGDALQALGGPRAQQQMVLIYQNGPTGAAWVMLRDTCEAPAHVGIIMPCRAKDSSTQETATARVAVLMGGA